jgi:serine/threonine-protein kinase
MTGELLWRNQVQISDHFAGVLQKMLEISVRHRYQSAEAILRDLDLEPYFDSLAQNMTYSSPSTPGMNSSSKTSLNGGSNSQANRGYRTGSPSLRMAAAIRARRERSSSTSGSQGSKFGDYSHSPSPNSLLASSPGKQQPSPLLSSQDVKEKYLKGRRDFSSQTFTNLDMQRTALTDISFNQSEVAFANFQGSDLTNANFGRSNLSSANLRNAKLVKAYFHCANLEGADLRGANLGQACLSNANLRGANLCGADLTGALISDEQIARAQTNWHTILPNGQRGA